jgi:hypothetical protein
MKVILQQVDTSRVVKIVFYNNTPQNEYILKNNIGQNCFKTSLPEFMTDVIKQQNVEQEENLIVILPGQTFTNLATVDENIVFDDNNELFYVCYQPLYNDGFHYLVKSLPIHFIKE